MDGRSGNYGQAGRACPDNANRIGTVPLSREMAEGGITPTARFSNRRTAEGGSAH